MVKPVTEIDLNNDELRGNCHLGRTTREQMNPIDDMTGWPIPDEFKHKVDQILADTFSDTLGPEFMAPPKR